MDGQILSLLDARPTFADSWRMDVLERITIDPARRSGKPCIRDTRIAVYDVLDYLASGMSEEDILNDFPELGVGDIRARLTRYRRIPRRGRQCPYGDHD